MVHGTEEVHSLIRQAAIPNDLNVNINNVNKSSRREPNDQVQEEPSGDILETSVNGVWSLFIGSRLFGKDFEAVKVI